MEYRLSRSRFLAQSSRLWEGPLPSTDGKWPVKLVRCETRASTATSYNEVSAPYQSMGSNHNFKWNPDSGPRQMLAANDARRYPLEKTTLSDR